MLKWIKDCNCTKKPRGLKFLNKAFEEDTPESFKDKMLHINTGYP